MEAGSCLPGEARTIGSNHRRNYLNHLALLVELGPGRTVPDARLQPAASKEECKEVLPNAPSYYIFTFSDA